MIDIRAVILDAGGVFVHPVHGNWDIPARYMELLGPYSSDIAGKAFFEACLAERGYYLNEDRYLPDIHDEYQCRYDFLAAISRRLNWALNDVQLQALAHDFTYNEERYAWYPDTDTVLAELHRVYKIGVLSDAMPSFRIVADKHDSSLHHFDAISISCEVGCAKPNPRMYEDILSKLKIPACHCLFVDDRVCNLEGAARLGIHTVQMCRDGLPGWDGPKVTNLTELKAYLEALR